MLAVVVASATFAACSEGRRAPGPPTYDSDVGAILAARCTNCHPNATSGPGAWSASSYLSAVACVAGGAPAVLPADDAAPLLRAITDTTHRGLLSEGERSKLRAWVRAGSPKFAGQVHDPSFVDPRSERSHARMLRAEKWRSMLDANSDQACGRCHDGAPSGRPPKVLSSAPGATPCTSCHQEPQGVLACGTCHGDGQRAAPPRDPCFFPDDRARAGAHAAHVGPSAVRGAGLPCSTCHPVDPLLAGAHGNGVVEVELTGLAGASSYDRATRTCTTPCHSRPGAARPAPAWSEKGPLGCGDCHGAPPPEHMTGACASCHREVDAQATALVSPVLHVNGRVDLGDGSRQCGACHGAGDDPWPKTGAHGGHRAPANAAAVACDACHEVPATSGAGTEHPRGGSARVVFSGIALARGARPSLSGSACDQVYCHGAGLVGTTPAAPLWTDLSGTSKSCTGCHGQPPGAPHIAATSCWTCHPSVIDPGPTGPRVSVPSRHVNGDVDR